MDVNNPFKHRLRDSDVPLCGAWMQLASNLAAEALAYSGFDWMLVDAEHAPNDIPNIISQLQAIAAGSSAPMVRPSVNDPVLLKRLLDAGVQTFLIPNVNSAEEAASAVRSVRYAPAGIRGVALCTRANRFGHSPDYYARANEEMCVIVQIETLTAVERVHEIAAVEGVDCLFVGPGDLAADMGHIGNPSHSDVEAAIARIVDAAKAAGKPIGTVSFGPADARQKFVDGFRFVSVCSDLPTMIKGCEQLLATVRE